MLLVLPVLPVLPVTVGATESYWCYVCYVRYGRLNVTDCGYFVTFGGSEEEHVTKRSISMTISI